MDSNFLDGQNVRAIDLGYGNVKYTLAHPDSFGPIKCDIFPSRSPTASDSGLAAGLAQKRNTAIIKIRGVEYEVGRDVAQAQGTFDTSAVLDNDFCLSDAYLARMRGAFHYMLNEKDAKTHKKHMHNNRIDLLVVGLPVSNFRNVELRSKLRDRMIGKHELSNGQEIEVDKVIVMPQPMGSFFEHAFDNSMFDTMQKQNNLVIDPGFFTFDWLMSAGLMPNDTRSDSVSRGMSAVLKSIAEAMKKKHPHWKTDVSMIVRLMDDHLRDGVPLIIFQQEHKLEDYIDAGRPIINEAVAALSNNVGDGADIHNILVSGGGAKLYLDAVQEKFPNHKLLVMENPVYSNVRGFQLAGERHLLNSLRKQRKEALNAAD